MHVRVPPQCASSTIFLLFFRAFAEKKNKISSSRVSLSRPSTPCRSRDFLTEEGFVARGQGNRHFRFSPREKVVRFPLSIFSFSLSFFLFFFFPSKSYPRFPNIYTCSIRYNVCCDQRRLKRRRRKGKKSSYDSVSFLLIRDVLIYKEKIGGCFAE